jgi:hypothetical protein
MQRYTVLCGFDDDLQFSLLDEFGKLSKVAKAWRSGRKSAVLAATHQQAITA